MRLVLSRNWNRCSSVLLDLTEQSSFCIYSTFASAVRRVTDYFIQTQLCQIANALPGSARHRNDSDKEGDSVLELFIVPLDRRTSEKVSQ